MGMMRKQGEQVQLSFQSNTPAAVNQISIYDSNGVSRPLQTWERLIVDVIEFDTEGANDTTHLAYVVAAASAPSGSTDPSAPTIASFTVSQALPNQGQAFSGEGLSVNVGYNLYLVLSGNSWTGTSVNISGSARVLNGKTQGVRAGYKELLTAGGSNAF